MLQNRLQPVLDPYRLAREMSAKMLIDGGMVGSITGRTFPIVNPATQERIGEAARISQRFSIDEMVPAAGQGIIAVQMRKNDRDIAKVLAKIDDEVSALLRQAEKRAIDLLNANLNKLHRLVDLLLANETVNGSDVYAIAGVPEPSGVDTGFTMAPDRAAAAAAAATHQPASATTRPAGEAK